MPILLACFLLFVVVGAGFILVNLIAGYLVRPVKPDPEKATIYECGEPTVGTSWIQFDLRFYVVALLFVIFDVEMVFFFPWAVVYGKLNTLANPELTTGQVTTQREEVTRSLFPRTPENLTISETEAKDPEKGMAKNANQLAWFAFADILFFFAVLIVGFAYLWRRGDLNWVRSLDAEEGPAMADSDGPPEAVPSVMAQPAAVAAAH
jgi:NADH-quinone oxidoreductase subunit A